MNECGGYDAEDYLRRYIAFMTTSGNHRDTCIEECHRNFFANDAEGLPPRQSGNAATRGVMPARPHLRGAVPFRPHGECPGLTSQGTGRIIHYHWFAIDRSPLLGSSICR